MTQMLSEIQPHFLVLAFVVTMAAGLVKGVTGFAMPMVMISGLSSFLSPEVALAALLLPTLTSNLWQALRQGIAAARLTLRRFSVYLITMLAMLVLSAQLVRSIPASVLYLLIGFPITVFAAMQLFGFRPKVTPNRWIEGAIGSFAGFIGGISGVWGPPTVAYLTAIETPKSDQMRVQGVIYAVGAVALVGAHLQSGVLTAGTAPLSALMIVPATLGMAVGLAVQDRFDQETFRKVTLVVLIVAGANLIRKGLIG